MGVLDDMTKGITERKAAAAGPKLTPVGAEASPTKPSRAGIPDVSEVFLSNEALIDHAKGLRKFAADALAIADGLDAMTAKDTATVATPDTKAIQKAIEKVADEKFAADFAAKQAAAQAAAFPELDADLADDTVTTSTAEVSVAAGGWVCPDHGAEDIANLKSRKGRDYRACNVKGCEQFEK